MSKERVEWLAQLKVGDKVAYDVAPTYAGEPIWIVETIEKVTPARQFRLKNGSLFNKDGEKGHGPHFTWLVPATPEIEESIKRRRLMNKIEKTNWKALSTARLERVVQAIREEEMGIDE